MRSFYCVLRVGIGVLALLCQTGLGNANALTSQQRQEVEHLRLRHGNKQHHHGRHQHHHRHHHHRGARLAERFEDERGDARRDIDSSTSGLDVGTKGTATNRKVKNSASKARLAARFFGGAIGMSSTRTMSTGRGGSSRRIEEASDTSTNMGNFIVSTSASSTSTSTSRLGTSTTSSTSSNSEESLDLSPLHSLNSLLSTTSDEFAAKKAECAALQSRTKGQLRSADLNLQETQSNIARATAALLEAQTEKAQKERRLRQLEEAATDGRRDCARQQKSLEEELRAAQSEAQTTTEVLKASCPERVKELVVDGPSDTTGGATAFLEVSRRQQRRTASLGRTKQGVRQRRTASLGRTKQGERRSGSSSRFKMRKCHVKKGLDTKMATDGKREDAEENSSKSVSFPHRKEAKRRSSEIRAKGKASSVDDMHSTGEQEGRFHRALSANKRRSKHRFLDVGAEDEHHGHRHLEKHHHFHQSHHLHGHHLHGHFSRHQTHDEAQYHTSHRHRHRRNYHHRFPHRFGHFARRHYDDEFVPRRGHFARRHYDDEFVPRRGRHQHYDYVEGEHSDLHRLDEDAENDDPHHSSSSTTVFLEAQDEGNDSASTSHYPDEDLLQEEHTTEKKKPLSVSLLQTSLRLLLKDVPEPLPDTCTPSVAPSCAHFEAAMTALLQSSAAETEGRKSNLAKQAENCRGQAEISSQMMQQARDELNVLNGRIARLTAQQGQSRADLELLSRKKTAVDTDRSRGLQQCEEELAESDDAICKLRKARGEMMTMRGIKGLPQDCEVSEWEGNQADCTAHCAVGSSAKRMAFFYATREVVASNNELGMQCPNEMKRKMACPSSACAVDCEVSDWSEWSECSAHCGPGVRHRIRHVLREAAAGGKQCPSTSDMENCVARSCNQDCVLSDWTSWDQCSQTCGTGLQLRRRDVVAVPEGAGTCAAPSSPLRREFRPCGVEDAGSKNMNTTSTPVGTTSSSSSLASSSISTSTEQHSATCQGRTCQGHTDLVVLLDVSSGADVANNVKAVSKMLESMKLEKKTNVQVSVVAVRGPSFLEILGASSPATYASQKRAAQMAREPTEDQTASEDEGSKSSAKATAETLVQWSADLTGEIVPALQKALASGASGTGTTTGANGPTNGPFDIWRGLALARALFSAPGARQDAQQKVLVFSSSNFLPNFAALSMLQEQRFRAHLVAVKIGGMSSLSQSAWVEVSKELNQNYPKATINRSVFQFASVDSFLTHYVEKVLPSLCGVDLRV